MLLSIFNHNAPLAMAYMVVIMLTAIIGTLPQLFKNSKRGLGIGAIGILTFLMALVPIQSADFVHAAYAFQHKIGLAHFEDFFIWLYNSCQDIHLWRIIVFGATTLFFLWTVKLLRVNKKFAAFIFVITQMFMFGALRNMLGIMLMFMGVAAVFYKPKRFTRWGWVILGIAALAGCSYLHRSMPLYILLLTFALIPFGTKTIKISLIAFPVLYGSIFIMSLWFMQQFFPDLSDHAELYTESERGTTLMKTINETLKQGAYLYLLYLVYKGYDKCMFAFPAVIKFLMRYAYILIYLGFLFCGQGTAGWLFERFVWTGDIALMFVIMWFFYHYPRTRGVKIAFAILIYQILYQMLYICTHASERFITRFNTIEI